MPEPQAAPSLSHRTRAAAAGRWRPLWGILLVLLLAALVLAKLLHHEHVAQAMLHPPRQTLAPDALSQARQALRPDLQAVSFATSDGLLLHGWYLPSRSGAVVVFVHGGQSNRSWFLDQARALAQRGLGVLLYDSRANGESEGETQSWGDLEQEDLTAALDWVSARPDADPRRLGAAGFSIGATTVCMVAAGDQRLKAVLLDSLWPSLREELRHKAGSALGAWLLRFDFWWAGVDIDYVRPEQAIARIAPRPLRLVAGEIDRDTPPELAQRLFDQAGEPKALWRIPGADHLAQRELGGAAQREAVARFFAESL